MFDVENMQAETRAVPKAAAESKHRYTYRPLADILETEAGVELAVEMPGVDSDEVDIQLHRRVLTIKGRTQVNEPSGASSLTRSTVRETSSVPLGSRGSLAGRISRLKCETACSGSNCRVPKQPAPSASR